MKTDKLLTALEELVEQQGYEIRKERGNFHGDHCIVEGDKLVVVNKNRPKEMQVGIIARVLRELDLQDIYIKPAIRKHLEELWDRFDRFETEDDQELESEENEA